MAIANKQKRAYSAQALHAKQRTPSAALRKLEIAHDWFEYRAITCCRMCGIVKRADGKNKPCKGPVKVELRS